MAARKYTRVGRTWAGAGGACHLSAISRELGTVSSHSDCSMRLQHAAFTIGSCAHGNKGAVSGRSISRNGTLVLHSQVAAAPTSMRAGIMMLHQHQAYSV